MSALGSGRHIRRMAVVFHRTPDGAVADVHGSEVAGTDTRVNETHAGRGPDIDFYPRQRSRPNGDNWALGDYPQLPVSRGQTERHSARGPTKLDPRALPYILCDVLHSRSGRGIAQAADAIMVLLHAPVLPLDDRPHVSGQIVPQRSFIRFLGDVLAALALCEHSGLVHSSDAG